MKLLLLSILVLILLYKICNIREGLLIPDSANNPMNNEPKIITKKLANLSLITRIPVSSNKIAFSFMI